MLALNPQRRERILQATGWKDLVPGTLNLEVAEDSVHRLLLCTPVIREKGKDVKYPQQYVRIPTLRVGYLLLLGQNQERRKSRNTTVSRLVKVYENTGKRS